MFVAPVYAHSSPAGVGDFYAGFLHPLTALEHLLPFAALGLLAGQYPAKGEYALPVFCGALVVGAAAAWLRPGLGGVDFLNVGSMLVLGALVAAELAMPLFAYLGIAAAFGATHGYANGAAMTSTVKVLAFMTGLALAGFFAAGYGFAVADYLGRRSVRWPRIAVRVAGSWIAAIGILVLATSTLRP